MAKSKTITAPSSERQSVSVSVEKISNGFLIRKSHYDGKNYKDTTEYSSTKPKLEIPTPTKRGGK